jgi:PPM family protein phosphatase
MLRVADDVFAKTDTGRQRRGNEDAYLARTPLFVIADGMGGAQAGEVASQMAVKTLRQGLPDGGGPPQDLLAERIEEANQAIHEHSRADAERAGMGTTTTAVYVAGEEAAIAHVGDSRAYRLRDGRLEQLTDDHSLVEELRRQGKLTAEEAHEHPQKSIITRALGPEPVVPVDRQTIPLRAGDVFLLCSDGLTSMVDDDVIAGVLTDAPSLQEAGRQLIAAANEAGGRDNITVILFRVEEIEVGAQALDQPTEQQTTAGDETAPRTADVRAAVATAQRADTAAHVEPRAPRLRTTSPPTRRRRGIPGPVKVLIVVVVIAVPVAVGLYAASQVIYFVGTDDQARVTVYRGLPYDLPLGARLYSTNYVSGVSVAEVPAPRRGKLLDHTLRSRSDAYDLVRRLERGQVR